MVEHFSIDFDLMRTRIATRIANRNRPIIGAHPRRNVTLYLVDSVMHFLLLFTNMFCISCDDGKDYLIVVRGTVSDPHEPRDKISI